MQQQRRLVMIGLVALAVAGSMTVWAYHSIMSKVVQVRSQNTRVVIATKDLPVGTMLAADDVQVVDMPSSSLPQGTLSDPAKAIGHGAIVKMGKNELVLETKLAGDKAGAGLPSMIPTNMRAVSVQVNEVIAVAGFVAPGTRVDVLLTGSPGTNNSNDVMTTTVLENVEVLAAGQSIQPDATGNKPEKVPVITLLVSPEDAQKLTLASSQGKIQLSLRNPLDEKQDKPETVKNATLYHVPAPEVAPQPVKRISAPVKKAVVPVPAAYMVEVIRGDKRDSAKF